MFNLLERHEQLQQERLDRQEALHHNIKQSAALALRSGFAYSWEWYEDKHFQVPPALKNCVDFMQAHETGDYTLNNLMLEILEKCDGKSSKNANSIAIEYMAHLIANLEVEAWEDDESC